MESALSSIFWISIHALRVEGDLFFASAASPWRVDFYPRPPGGGRPSAPFPYFTVHPDFYPRPPGGGRLTSLFSDCPLIRISIHALRVEGDLRPVSRATCSEISIHALRVEGDSMSPSTTGIVPGFLSTPSGWRATREAWRAFAIQSGISIHALRVEGDRQCG